MSIPAKLVLASSELNARARILEAAGPRAVVTTGATGYSTHLPGAAILVLDLDEGGTRALEELVDARTAGLAPPVVFGFFSHVDRDLGKMAREAGCTTISRGRFWTHLTELLAEKGPIGPAPPPP